jgi:hypothetical protein
MKLRRFLRWLLTRRLHNDTKPWAEYYRVGHRIDKSTSGRDLPFRAHLRREGIYTIRYIARGVWWEVKKIITGGK